MKQAMKELHLYGLREIADERILPRGYWDKYLTKTESEDTVRERRKRKEAGEMTDGMTLREISNSRILVTHCKNYWKPNPNKKPTRVDIKGLIHDKKYIAMSFKERYQELQRQLKLKAKEQADLENKWGM